VVGRVFVGVITLVSIGWIPLATEAQGGQIFIYMQEVTDYLAPPIATLYLLAMFYSRLNEVGAFMGLISGFLMGITRLILSIITTSNVEEVRIKLPCYYYYYYYY